MSNGRSAPRAVWRPLLGALTALAFVTVGLGAAPAAAQDVATGKVVVVHGLRGRVLDVYLDDRLVLGSFAPDRLTEPLDVPEGSHRFAVRAPGAPSDAPPVAETTATVAPGATASVVAHLSAEGSPEITVYDDAVAATPLGETDVIVRHSAAAPPIDVLFGADPVVTNLSNGREATTFVPVSTYQVSVDEAGGGPLVAANAVDMENATRMILYLVGSAADDSLTWLAQPTRIPIPADGTGPVPTAVQAGGSGLADVTRTAPIAVLLVLLVGAVLTAPRTRRDPARVPVPVRGRAGRRHRRPTGR